jgi:predicted nucleic acid-binding protein
MKVVVDTSVWSLALRRSSSVNVPQVTLLQNLIAEGQVVLIGAVRQEILSGIREVEQYTRLRGNLRAFPDVEIVAEDYETAAEFYNTCRQNGVQGANTDFLLCAFAYRRSYRILTTDCDFENFRVHLPIRLVEI